MMGSFSGDGDADSDGDNDDDDDDDDGGGGGGGGGVGHVMTNIRTGRMQDDKNNDLKGSKAATLLSCPSES